MAKSQVTKKKPRWSEVKSSARSSQLKLKVKPPAESPPSPRPLKGSFKLTWQAIATLRRFWKPLGGILLIYAILNIVLAGGLSNISSAVDNLRSRVEGSTNLRTALGDFGSLFDSGASGSESSSLMASLLLILGSLVIIWALRNLLAGNPISVKQAYYQSTAPLVPFLLVLVFIFIQLLPLGLGAAVLSILLSASGAGGGYAEALFGGVLIILAVWTVYMLSCSIFALYIVTLPDMTPRKALHSAKSLVHRRRWQLSRRLLFLPIFILLIMALVVLPFILFLTPLVTIIFFVLSTIALLFAHTYIYGLYRNLIA